MRALEQIKTLEADYEPNRLVAAELQDKVAIGLIGPFAVGKTTIMTEAAMLSNDIAVAGTITTRTPEERDKDSRYEFLADKSSTYNDLLKRIKSGELVQYAVHPTTDKFYGSRLSDYPAPINMIDLVTSAVEPFSKIPFKRFDVVSVVCPDLHWIMRVTDRFYTIGSVETKKRIDEAIINLEWSLSHDDMLWLHNPNRRVKHAAKELVRFTLGEEELYSSGRKSAEGMLNTARNLANSISW